MSIRGFVRTSSRDMRAFCLWWLPYCHGVEVTVLPVGRKCSLSPGQEGLYRDKAKTPLVDRIGPFGVFPYPNGDCLGNRLVALKNVQDELLEEGKEAGFHCTLRQTGGVEVPTMEM